MYKLAKFNQNLLKKRNKKIDVMLDCHRKAKYGGKYHNFDVSLRYELAKIYAKVKSELGEVDKVELQLAIERA